MMRGPALILIGLLAGRGTAAAQAPPAPLDLREALGEALRASPALTAPQDAIEVARIQSVLAESRFGLKVQPVLNLGSAPNGLGQRLVGVDVTKRLPLGTDVTTSFNTTTYGTGVSRIRDAGYTFGISQPLFRGAGAATTAEVKNARRAVEGSERGLLESRQQLIVTVADRFFSVLKQRRLVDASERALGRAQTMSRAADARAEVGLSTQLDVLRADLLVSQATVTLSSQREALATAMEDLNLLLGRDPGGALDVADEDVSDEGLAALGFHVPDAARGDAVGMLVTTALQARPAVLEARDRVHDAERNVDVSRWNLLPQVNVNASYTDRGIGAWTVPGYAELVNGWRFGVTTNYSLDRADQRAAAGTAGVSLRAAEQAAGDTARRIEAEVRRAFRTWERTRETIDIQRKSLEVADKQVRLATLRYERGLATSLDIIDAENNLYQVQSALIDAELGRALALLVLERAAGTLAPERFAP